MTSTSTYAEDLHDNGVHTRCTLAPRWAGSGQRMGDGTSAKCVKAGRVERFHSHDHDGPLDCGCEEFAD